MESNDEGPIGWTLLTRYVAGSCTEDEEIVVETWAAADPRNRRVLKDLQNVWETVSKREEGLLSVDVDAAWKNVEDQIEEIEDENSVRSGPAKEKRHRDRRARRRSRSWNRRLRIGLGAAAVILTSAIALFLFDLRPDSEPTSDKKVFTTARGQRAIIQLTDGSNVRLNVDSRLVLPDRDFSGDRRDVRLYGQAYFEVVPDTSRPFRVHTRGASVQVLGTSFDVRAYDDDEVQTEVAVAEGEVALNTEEEAGTSASMEVHSKQVGVAGKELKKYRDVDISERLAWTEGRLVFEGAPLRDVVRQLERWYNLEIELEVPPNSVDRLNATFDDESMRQVLDDIAIALSLQYSKNGKVVTFYRHSSNASPSSTEGRIKRAR